MYAAVTVTTGGAIAGYCATGSVGMVTKPAIKIMSEQTAEKIGRRKKIFVMKPYSEAWLSSTDTLLYAMVALIPQGANLALSHEIRSVKASEISKLWSAS